MHGLKIVVVLIIVSIIHDSWFLVYTYVVFYGFLLLNNNAQRLTNFNYNILFKTPKGHQSDTRIAYAELCQYNAICPKSQNHDGLANFKENLYSATLSIGHLSNCP